MPCECTGHSHDDQLNDDSGTSLQSFINLPQVYCLNETIPHSCRSIFKPYADRFQDTPSLISHEDDYDPPELIVHIPFLEAVAMYSISIRGIDTKLTSSPKLCHLYVNRVNLDFQSVQELPPTMTIELVPSTHVEGMSVDYPLRPVWKFQFVSILTLHFLNSYRSNEDTKEYVPIEIAYVGMKGKGTKAKRIAVDTVYESRGMKKDHKVEIGDWNVKYDGL